ncbi:MAG: hypothetical protein ACQESF_00275 [Nanobdellota archaeon]
MPKNINSEIKFIIASLFIIIIILANQLFVPHTVLFGLIFIKGKIAFIITLAFVLALGAAIPLIMKKYKTFYWLFYAIIIFLVINSFLNILAAIFIKEDIVGFIYSVFERQGYFKGFLINQILLLCMGLFSLKKIYRLK